MEEEEPEEGVTHSKGLFEALKVRSKEAELERKAVERITLEARELSVHRDPTARRAKDIRRHLRWVAVWLVTVAVFSGLVWLAMASDTAFKMVTSFIWFYLYMFISWYPVRTVAGFGVGPNTKKGLDVIAGFGALFASCLDVGIVADEEFNSARVFGLLGIVDSSTPEGFAVSRYPRKDVALAVANGFSIILLPTFLYILRVTKSRAVKKEHTVASKASLGLTGTRDTHSEEAVRAM